MAALPPSYETEGSIILLNITPSAESVGFQTGFLGVSKSALAGEVQVKQVGTAHVGYRALELTFRGVERTDGLRGSEVELCHHQQVLWNVDEPSTSQAASSGLPASLPFEIELTPDLPHCVHTGHSSLEYTLRAQLLPHEGSGAQLVDATVPVHLTRYAPSTDRFRHHTELEGTRDRCTDTATTFSLAHPLTAHVSLGRTIFRRSEPIELRVTVKPPSSALVTDKGVLLRSISADLVRVIRRDRPPRDDESDEEDHIDDEVRTVLSHSGKGARFTPFRDLFLRLWLQPAAPFDGEPSCETITQSTIQHEVEFRISVTFSLAGRDGDRETLVLERRILILPDQPPSVRSIRSEKQRAAAEEQMEEDVVLHTPAPQYQSQGPQIGDAEPSTSAPAGSSRDIVPTWWDGEDQDEYDGYEEASAGAELIHAPPTIDEDSAPPSLEESDGLSSHDTDLTRPMTPSDSGQAVHPPHNDNVPPPEYAGEEVPMSSLPQQPPAYSASRRAGEVEVVPVERRRTEHGIV